MEFVDMANRIPRYCQTGCRHKTQTFSVSWQRAMHVRYGSFQSFLCRETNVKTLDVPQPTVGKFVLHQSLAAEEHESVRHEHVKLSAGQILRQAYSQTDKRVPEQGL